jgi:hypothetical protein
MFEWFALGGLVVSAFSLVSILKEAERHTRQLTNIADRLLDIQNKLDRRG